MINKVDKLCYQFGHVTFLKSILVCKLFIAFFINFFTSNFQIYDVCEKNAQQKVPLVKVM